MEESKNFLFPRINNLEWLRLTFAMQVVFVHAAHHLSFGYKLPSFISNFPGVPAFFFVSGFLIYSSYLNAPGKRYFENRFLRLFPGLFVVTVGGALVVLLAQGWGSFQDNLRIFAVWFLAQVTLGQAYNPELFRTVGVGVINGSLWTITTEIVFYLCVPVIVWLEKRFRFTVVALCLVSFAVYATGPDLLHAPIRGDKTLFDLMALTPLVWGWMFGFGILAVKYYKQIESLVKYAPVLVLPLVAMIFVGDGILFQASGNRLGLIYFACYVGLIMWFAFWLPHIRLSFDLSYGAYIWHMPIINMLLVLSIPDVALAILITLIISALSWFWVEKPVLKLKHQTLRPV